MAEAIEVPGVTKAGPGATTAAVGIRDGQMVMQFPNAVQWLAVDPQTAVNIGEALARAGYEIRHGHQPPDNTAVLQEEIKRRATDMIRLSMITRSEIILRQLLERNRSLNYIATELVDRMLQEVA